MNISVHPLPNDHTAETAWVDEALASATALGEPLGALVGRPLLDGDAIMLVAWATAGPDRYQVFDTRTGRSAGPARYMHLVSFDGPRTQEWTDAEQRAADGRLWPATRDIAGVVRVIRMRADDNAYVVAILTNSVEAIEEAATAIMSTPLLPDEDPRLLSQPDRMQIYRLVHADLPTEITSHASSPGA
jgi:hypothetical protein